MDGHEVQRPTLSGQAADRAETVSGRRWERQTALMPKLTLPPPVHTERCCKQPRRFVCMLPPPVPGPAAALKHPHLLGQAVRAALLNLPLAFSDRNWIIGAQLGMVRNWSAAQHACI